MANTKQAEIRAGQLVIRFLIEGTDAGESLAAFEFEVPSGSRVPVAHSHDAYDETIYGLTGVLTFTVEGQKLDVGPGEVLFIPRGAVHRFDNPHASDAKMLAVITPGILRSDYFREIAAVIQAAGGGPPNIAAVAGVMRRHGLTPVP